MSLPFHEPYISTKVIKPNTESMILLSCQIEISMVVRGIESALTVRNLASEDMSNEAS